MGFIASADTVTLTAKLTPFGRQQLLSNSSSIITQFSLGDSDANYTIDDTLGRGQVPSLAGEIGTNDLFSNGVYSNVKIKSTIIVNNSGDVRKPIAAGSNQVVITPKHFGLKTITGSTTGDTITQLITSREIAQADSYSNLFKSFGLPITQDEINKYTTFTSGSGGYLDTAIKNINNKKIIVIAIEKCEYGEIIDGKTVKVDIQTTGATTSYTLYSTFQKTLTPVTNVDNQITETGSLGSAIGNNIAFLFSDKIKRPNNNPNKSWATGYGLPKPFSLNNKERFNSTSVPSTSTVVDEAVGVAYLDKGFIVITNSTIVNSFDPSNIQGTSVRFNHLSNEVAQNITCVVERDEFATTNNSTHGTGDLIRVSEVALYDNFNNVIAFAKSNEHIIIGASQYLVLGVRILV